MQRTLGLVILAAVIGGGWFLWKHYELRGLQQVRFVPRGESEKNAVTFVFGEPPRSAGKSIRVLSMSCPLIEPAHPDAKNGLAAALEMMSEADVVALYGIRSASAHLLPDLVGKLNKGGRRFEYLAGSAVGPPNDRRRFAILFDANSIASDRRYAYHVGDPDDLMQHEPLVGWFQVRTQSADLAFTFNLVVADVDWQQLDREWRGMEETYRTLRHDGRGEDDVIFVGNLGPEVAEQISSSRWQLVSAVEEAGESKTAGIANDALLLAWRLTHEFTARAGNIDVVRRYNLTVEQAQQISRAAPVWAEFATHETRPTESALPTLGASL